MNDQSLGKRLAAGPLARMGLLDDAACGAAADLIGRVENSGLETIRVLFADQHGILRGKTLVTSALESVFMRGLAAPSTLLLKDTAHRTVFPVWDGGSDSPMQGAGDILMVPRPTDFYELPWSPHSAWLLCDPVMKDGTNIPFAPRHLLRQAIAQLKDAGLSMLVGLEVEFHVFEVTDPALDHIDATMPPRAPATRNLSQGWQFLTDGHYSRLEPIMDELRRNCAALGLPVRSTEVEMGPSQFEFTFDPADPMTHADNMVIFRTMVKEVCALRGLHATFMCRPVVDNCAASGWHLHQSLQDTSSGKALFIPETDGVLTAQASGWIAGLLEHAAATCLLTTPTVNGYKRYQPHQLAPDAIAWGRDNRGTMIRALMTPGDSASRIENRVAEPTANPYLFFASQIICGLDGITRSLVAPDACETPYAGGLQKLPADLGAALAAFEGSTLYRTAWGDEVVDYLLRLKRAEWRRYLDTLSAWEQDEYFSLY